MVGELDAGKPHVQFDEGAQETCDSATRLCPTLPQPLAILSQATHARQRPGIALAIVAACDFGTTNVADAATGRRALIDPSATRTSASPEGCRGDSRGHSKLPANGGEALI